MLTLRLEIIGLFGHVRITPKKPRKYGLASGAVSSPPRVRGNLQRALYPPRIGWSIPARAGEPGVQACPTTPTWVYPRACGGTALPRGLFQAFEGLSPRVRGNHEAGVVEALGLRSIPARAGAVIGHAPHVVNRSIPARAGEPFGERYGSRQPQVYPRACGGTRSAGLQVRLQPGLSPRVRGNLSAASRANARHGSIPACTGEPAPLS